MPADSLELVLDHDGHDWQVHGAGISVCAASLPALDRALAEVLAAGMTADAVTVHMRFSRESLPGWTRQYMPHYFNRTIRLHPREITGTSP
ncbi:MAG: DUF5395 family protein [Gammaproteobacteria bacterium]|nr:DUF5395 family protein [Gammaproteobacteria bacterium]